MFNLLPQKKTFLYLALSWLVCLLRYLCFLLSVFSRIYFSRQIWRWCLKRIISNDIISCIFYTILCYFPMSRYISCGIITFWTLRTHVKQHMVTCLVKFRFVAVFINVILVGNRVAKSNQIRRYKACAIEYVFY